jgi:hypothetical protein
MRKLFPSRPRPLKVQHPLTSRSIRLATHLYAESLVDRDHYMDWLVSGLENSSQAKLPMWILVTQIYWKDLLRLRRYGRRLVAGLLTHLNTVCAARSRAGRRRPETNMSTRSIKTPIETSWHH